MRRIPGEERASRDAAGLGHGARHVDPRRARARRRLRRSDTIEQYEGQRSEGRPPRRLFRPLHPLRRARARNGGGDEWHRRARRSYSLWRDVPDLLRLRAAVDPARRVHGRRRHLCDDPRLDRAWRRRPDAPAGRASGGLARDAGALRLPPRRPGRDRGMLGARITKARRPVPLSPHPAIGALIAPRAGFREPVGPRGLCARGGRRSAPNHLAGHRLGAFGRNGGTGDISARGHPRRRRVDAMLGAVREIAAGIPGCGPRFGAARRRRSRRRVRLGAVAGTARSLHRHAGVWRLGARRSAVSAFRHHPRKGCGSGPLAPIDREGSLGGRTMAVRVAINGFGRIGRLVLRAAYEHKHTEIEVVGVNDLGLVETNAHLLRYDSVHGRFPGEITTGENWMDIGRGKIRVAAERDPAKLPWRELGVDVALECTGFFTKREAAAKHLEAGAKRVIISAPADGADMTVVMGVNQEALKPEHQVISNGSCTTNCLAPVAYVLHQGIGIERGFMTTIHSYTGDQSLQDTLHGDLRRARAAAQSMIPTSTGAARAIGLVLPALKGKLDGTAIRVPTANVSLIDLTFDAARETSGDEVNALMEEAARSNRLRGILGINKAPTVSVDFNHDPHSSTFDVTQTQVLDKRFVRVLAWYDNEWGFSNRMVEVAAYFGGLA